MGLQFYTIKSKVWPNNFSTEELVKGIQNKTDKYTYTNKDYSEDQILKSVKDGSIKLKNCWFSVEHDEFRRIRSGPAEERSPLDSRDPRLKKKKKTTKHSVIT